MDQRSLWFCLDINHSTVTKICAKNDFYIFVASVLDLLTSTLYSFVILSESGRTDGVQHLTQPPTEGRPHKNNNIFNH